MVYVYFSFRLFVFLIEMQENTSLKLKFCLQVCIKLGWKGKGTEWDILPLVVSANGHDPDYFDYPPELILEVPLSHPK